jgi:hypothetical protein
MIKGGGPANFYADTNIFQPPFKKSISAQLLPTTFIIRWIAARCRVWLSLFRLALSLFLLGMATCLA